LNAEITTNCENALCPFTICSGWLRWRYHEI
jgi:hypothetical protein